MNASTRTRWLIASVSLAAVVLLIVLGLWRWWRQNDLYAAIRAGDHASVAALLRRGASVHGSPGDPEYLPPLEAAAREGHDDIVALLLDHGADLHYASGWDGSALAAAARGGHASTIRLLLRRGASVKGEEGRRVLSIAKQEGHLEAWEVLAAAVAGGGE